MHNNQTQMQQGMRTLIWIVVACIAFFLNGCSTTSRKDGPPPFDVDASKIPDAVPKVEPLSRIGNKPYYTVFGTRYYVMRSSKHYEEQGVASWYGTKFHARHTSSGEKYNMLAMTAAHKTLPLPTYVQVTNLKNGRKVIVKVNDRGPFESNRLIDLSYVAAKKLGMLGHGTTHVDVKAIDPSEAYQHRELFAKNKFVLPRRQLVKRDHYRHFASYAKQSSVYLQVGAFRNKNHAQKLQRRLAVLVSSPVKIHSLRQLYRVQVGPLDVATANRISKRLDAAGLRSKRIT